MSTTTLCRSAGAVVGTTALGVAAALADPALARHTPPHPALAGTVADAASIFAANARVLSAPYLLWVLRADRQPAPRTLGDVLLGVIVVGNAVPIGLELGRWQARLIPYVPQLPIEWTALALALGGWLAIRTGEISGRTVLILAVGTAALLAVAAALETWTTPHAARQTTLSTAPSDAGNHLTRLSGSPGAVAFATDSAPAVATPLQGRTLPSPRAARFRSATQAGASRATSTTPGPPQGGTTR